ncbi:MAG TPA: hypothetical protein DHW63_02180 [Hyphomonadaceae bacterium]|nr:hypothetical protein [Hyphomonadaceae bacterium]
MHRARVIALKDAPLRTAALLGADTAVPITAFPALFWQNPAILVVTFLGVVAVALTALWVMTLMLPPWVCPATFLVFMMLLVLVLSFQMEIAGVLRQGTTADCIRAMGNWIKGRPGLGTTE